MGAFFSPSAALASDLAGKTRAEAAALGIGVASMVGFGIGPSVAGLLIQADISRLRRRLSSTLYPSSLPVCFSCPHSGRGHRLNRRKVRERQKLSITQWHGGLR